MVNLEQQFLTGHASEHSSYDRIKQAARLTRPIALQFAKPVLYMLLHYQMQQTPHSTTQNTQNLSHHGKQL